MLAGGRRPCHVAVSCALTAAACVCVPRPRPLGTRGCVPGPRSCQVVGPGVSGIVSPTGSFPTFVLRLPLLPPPSCPVRGPSKCSAAEGRPVAWWAYTRLDRSRAQEFRRPGPAEQGANRAAEVAAVGAPLFPVEAPSWAHSQSLLLLVFSRAPRSSSTRGTSSAFPGSTPRMKSTGCC